MSFQSMRCDADKRIKIQERGARRLVESHHVLRKWAHAPMHAPCAGPMGCGLYSKVFGRVSQLCGVAALLHPACTASQALGRRLSLCLLSCVRCLATMLCCLAVGFASPAAPAGLTPVDSPGVGRERGAKSVG